MGKATVIPFGPQHPVLPEPLHLDLVVEDETVIEAVPQIGFIHRGLEKLVETRDYNQFIYVAERICGICAFGHSMGYAETVEKLMGVEIPERADHDADKERRVRLLGDQRQSDGDDRRQQRPDGSVKHEKNLPRMQKAVIPGGRITAVHTKSVIKN